MKTHLGSSRPTSPRRKRQPLESDAGPSRRLDPPLQSQRAIRMRRLGQEGQGLHSHPKQTPRAHQKGARPGNAESEWPRNRRTMTEPERQQAPDRSAEEGASVPSAIRTEERYRQIRDRLRLRAEKDKEHSTLAMRSMRLLERQRAAPELQKGRDGSLKQAASFSPDLVLTEEALRKHQDTFSRRRTEGVKERLETVTSSMRVNDDDPSSKSERQQGPAQAAGQGFPGQYDYEIEEAFRELLDKLVRWNISTPEDVQVIKDELDKIAITPAPGPAPASPPKAEEKRSVDLDAASNEACLSDSRAEGWGEGSASGPSSMRPDDRQSRDYSRSARATDSTAATLAMPAPGVEERRPWLQRSDARRIEEEAKRKEQEVDSLAFDVVDALDAADPSDEYVFYEVEGKAEEDYAGLCHVSCGEDVGDVDGEYVLL
ncbi:hypothetical protein LZ32DRAFT_665272 [Colletotrichum eremochloae]|nr:hypothetical protein LZ32DRAFT_665272 [Colletotrichum eremochloae]